jgi:hypothetical protein
MLLERVYVLTLRVLLPSFRSYEPSWSAFLGVRKMCLSVVKFRRLITFVKLVHHRSESKT